MYKFILITHTGIAGCLSSILLSFSVVFAYLNEENFAIGIKTHIEYNSLVKQQAQSPNL